MGGFIAGGGHGPAGDGGPGISIQSELGVQAIADPQSIVECESNQRCGDVARDIGENDSYLLRHVVEIISGTKRVDGVVGQRMRMEWTPPGD